MISFKSCPREGASDYIKPLGLRLNVSSHAPVRGHRDFYRIPWPVWRVSSHAPVRGHPRL